MRALAPPATPTPLMVYHRQGNMTHPLKVGWHVLTVPVELYIDSSRFPK